MFEKTPKKIDDKINLIFPSDNTKLSQKIIRIYHYKLEIKKY